MGSACKLYSISEFGKLCSIHRKTLIYYDRIGILCPSVVQKNGYRFYSAPQVHQACLITTLKELGMTLAEIREFMRLQAERASIKTLESQEALLEKRIWHLSSVQDMIKARKRALRIAEKCDLYQPTIQWLEPRNLYISQSLYVAKDDSAFDDTSWDAFYDQCAQDAVSQSYLIGFLVQWDLLKKEDYIHASHIAFHVYDERFSNFTLPGGEYAVMYCNRYYADGTAYQKLLSFINNSGYQICGDSYEENILDDYSNIDPEKFISQISIPVRRT